MDNSVDLFNYLYNYENPLDIFCDPDSPYFDYYLKVENSNAFKEAMLRASTNKMLDWSMSIESQLANVLMAYYAGYFELFARDDIVSTFYNTFPVYCDNVLLETEGYVFKDVNRDTFLHYVSYVFDCRQAIKTLFRSVYPKHPNIKNPLHMQNLDGKSIDNILLLK